MSYNFVKLSDVDPVANATDGAMSLIVENGEVKKAPYAHANRFVVNPHTDNTVADSVTEAIGSIVIEDSLFEKLVEQIPNVLIEIDKDSGEDDSVVLHDYYAGIWAIASEQLPEVGQVSQAICNSGSGTFAFTSVTTYNLLVNSGVV